MKKKTGYSVGGIVAALAVVALLGIATFFIIDGNNKATDFNNYEFFSIIDATKDNGNIADHIKGYDPTTGTVTDNAEIAKKAPVIIYEYADYQCSGCASMNVRLNNLIESLKGKVSLVYRNYILSYHQNGTAAASAAEAAGLQGYWKPYADKLFNSQSEWYYATGAERTALFNQYFSEVTGGKGDIEKFNNDIASEAISKKISFDMGTGQRIDIPATPALFIEGKYLDLSSGKFEIAGQTFTWEDQMTNAQLTELLTNIIDAVIKSKEA